MPHTPNDTQGKIPYQDFGDSTLEMHLGGTTPYRIHSHAHPHFELLYILRGSRMLRMNGKTHRARSGDLIVFRPDEVHEEWAGSKKLSYVVIRFSSKRLSEVQVEFPHTEQVGPVIRLPNRERFTQLFTRMLEEKKRPQEGSTLLLGAYLVEFIVLLRRTTEEVLCGQEKRGNAPRTRIRTAIEIMQQNLSRDLNLEELARSTFLSVSHFSQVFKEEVGESPKRFLIKERIEKAKHLLATSPKTAQEIAQDLGYESPYFFYRQFKQKTGLTTAEYRKQNRPDTAT